MRSAAAEARRFIGGVNPSPTNQRQHHTALLIAYFALSKGLHSKERPWLVAFIQKERPTRQTDPVSVN
jgi:hypothetical protein